MFQFPPTPWKNRIGSLIHRRRKEKRDDVYARNIRVLMLSLSALVLLVALPLSWGFEAAARNIVFADAADLLTQTGREVSFLVDTGQKLAIQIYNDYSIRSLLYHDPPTEREKAMGLEQLSRYQHIMNFIDSVCLYNQRQQKVYLSAAVNEYGNRIVALNDYGDPGILAIIRDYRRYNAYAVIPRILSRQDGTPQHYYTFFGYDFTDRAENSELLCAVVVNISTDWVRTLTTPSSTNGRSVPGETLILDSDGRVISHSDSWPMMTDLSSETFLSGVLKPAGMASGGTSSSKASSGEVSGASAAASGSAGSSTEASSAAGSFTADPSSNAPSRLPDGSLIGRSMRTLDSVEGASDGGFRIETVRGVRTLVVWTAPDALGWRYLRLIPYSAVTRDIARIRNTSMLLAAAVLLAALLLTVPLNRTLLSPIERIRQHVLELQTRQRESRFELRRALLQRILAGEAPDPGGSLSRELEENRIPLQPGGCFHAVLLRIDRHERFVRENSSEDRKLLRFSVLNIAEELCSDRFSAAGTDLGGNRLVLLLNRPDGVPTGEEAFQTLFHEIREAVARHLGLSVSAAVSREGCELQHFPALLEDAESRMTRRFFAGHGCVLTPGETFPGFDTSKGPESACAQDPAYPERKEKAILDALNQGQPDKAARICREVLTEASTASWHTFIITVSRLELFLNLVSRNLRQDRPSEAGDIFRVDLDRMETMIELKDRFDGAFSAIAERIADRGRGRQNEVVERVNDILETRYADPLLGIETIAQMLGLSDGYIGRIYRQAAGFSILDRLSEIRMEKARSLLSDSNGPVSAIAGQVGFSSESYFYKNFRRSHGVTPTEYRRGRRGTLPADECADA